MLVYAIGMGTSFGLIFVAPPVLLLNYFGRKANLELYSLMGLFSVVAAAGPTLAGWSRDTLGSFTLLFLLLAAVSVVMLAARTPWLMTAPAGSPGQRPQASSQEKPLEKVRQPSTADLLLSGATVITLNADRHVASPTAPSLFAPRTGSSRSASGRRWPSRCRAGQMIDARRFVTHARSFVEQLPHTRQRRSADPRLHPRGTGRAVARTAVALGHSAVSRSD